MVKVSSSDVIGVAGIILAMLLVVLDKAGKLKGGWLYGLLFLAGVMTLFVAVGNEWVTDAPTKWRLWRGLSMCCVIGLAYSGLALWIAPSKGGTPEGKEQEHGDAKLGADNRPLTPNLVFVFGAPLGDNDSASWIMMLKHYGPGLAYACDIIFYDDDRKNIEHEWLVKHPDSPYPPPGLAGESQTRIYIPEVGPEGSAGSFRWNPLDPNSQHYTVSISCRDGVFVEKWEVTRVNGILRSAITIEHGPQWIEKNPGLKSVVFRYQDPEFVRTALATERPAVKKGTVVHPGWKPLHRFEVPMAIIDPNGNVQIVSAVKLPDGSTLTDFGSWNILTRHFGDKQDRAREP
ncbi:MAG: hypothetical protein WBE20_08960 [Candidatus Acidiferrales bacterium]